MMAHIVGSLRFDIYYKFELDMIEIITLRKNELVDKVELIFSLNLPKDCKRNFSLKAIGNTRMPQILLNISADINQPFSEKMLIQWLTVSVEQLTDTSDKRFFLGYRDGVVSFWDDHYYNPPIILGKEKSIRNFKRI